MKIEPAFSFQLFIFQLPKEKLKTMLVHNFGGQISCIVGLCGSGDLLHCTFKKVNLQIKPHTLSDTHRFSPENQTGSEDVHNARPFCSEGK